MSDEAKLDLLTGADQISDYMFGTKEERRRIYHLADHHELPVIKVGKTLYARKEALTEWIKARDLAGRDARRRGNK